MGNSTEGMVCAFHTIFLQVNSDLELRSQAALINSMWKLNVRESLLNECKLIYSGQREEIPFALYTSLIQILES